MMRDLCNGYDLGLYAGVAAGVGWFKTIGGSGGGGVLKVSIAIAVEYGGKSALS